MSCVNEAFAEAIMARLPEAFSMIALSTFVSLYHFVVSPPTLTYQPY